MGSDAWGGISFNAGAANGSKYSVKTDKGNKLVNYTRGADWNGQNGNVTTVGSATATSFYGAFDLGGNVWEWNEQIISSSRGLRGGSWNNNPGNENNNIGFRVASLQ